MTGMDAESEALDSYRHTTFHSPVESHGQTVTAGTADKGLPYLWRWSDLRRMAFRAGELVPIKRGGEKRVLAFVNPGLGGKYAATHTLWGAVRIVLPGEIAPCHRPSASAIRFIIEGSRCFTNVDHGKVRELGIRKENDGEILTMQ